MTRGAPAARSICAAIITAIQKPPFDKIGVFDLESFYPARDRAALAMAVNNLLASPGFSVWMSGEPLDIQRLLFTAEGKPRVSVLSIAHLDDAERMFFVTLLLNEIIGWMRNQSGTSSLRALLYMDEIFGYFPPTAQPPSKTPMLTLLKQARAFGVGVVLATQNPVDLDYKGLANAGTWLIGRLQTERDKMRVIEGLEGVLAGGADGLDRAAIDGLLSNLTSRVFLMRNVHDDRPVLFQSRWALSYLRGPLTLAEIRTLMAERRKPDSAAAAPSTDACGRLRELPSAYRRRRQRTVPQAHGAGAQPSVYQPRIAGLVRLHLSTPRRGSIAGTRQPMSRLFRRTVRTHCGRNRSAVDDFKNRFDATPAPGALYAELPVPATRAASYGAWGKSLESHLYQHARLDVLICSELGLTSNAGESEGDFRARLSQALREKRDEAITRLRAKYQPRLAAFQDRIRRAEERVAREQSQYSQQKMQSTISIGATILGALLGSRRISSGTLGRATTAARSAGRMGRENEDVARAEEWAEVMQQRLDALAADCEQEIAALQTELDPQTIGIRKAAGRRPQVRHRRVNRA